MQFCDHMSLLRREASLSFQQLSYRSCVYMAYLHRLERGQATNHSRNVVFRIGIALGLNIELLNELLASAGHMPLIPDKLGGGIEGNEQASQSLRVVDRLKD